MNPLKWISNLYSNQKMHLWQNKDRGITNRQIFDSIYKSHEWGGNPQEFYSGDGSHAALLVEPYIQLIRDLIMAYESPPVVVDLGCGDFFIGKHIFENTSRYYAIDVAEELISHNQLTYRNEKLFFQNIDATNEELPNADIILIRQVLQHLNNESITKIVEKLKQYESVVITEHLPSNSEFPPNIDINTGPGIRLIHNSGVVIHKAPFNFTGYNSAVLLDIPGFGGRIVTTHYKKCTSHAK